MVREGTQTPTLPPEETLTQLDLVRSGERLNILSEIDLDSIQIDFDLVDDEHSQELSDSMKQDRGQISPITVRAREDEGAVVYDIIDGFHRTHARKTSGDKTIKANVLYGCPDEELYDLRILAVNSVRSVQFPRLAEWMKRSFRETPWAERISLTQAFSMAVFDSKSSRLPGIEDAEVEPIKEWVLKKSSRWQRSHKSIWSNLRLIDVSDPSLVKEVRVPRGGTERKSVLTQGLLKEIAERFPGEEYYHVQRALARYSLYNRLGVTEAGERFFMIAGKIDTSLSEDEIYEQLEIIYQKEKAREERKRKSSYRPEIYASPLPDELSSQEVPDLSLDDIEDLVEGEDEMLVAQDDDMDLSDSNDNPNHLSEGREGRMPLVKRERFNVTPDTVKGLVSMVRELRSSLREANRKLAEGSGTNAFFWETAPYLTQQERTIMDALYRDIIPFNDLYQKLRITPVQLALTVQSVFVKKYHYHDGENFHLEKNGATNKVIDEEDEFSEDILTELEGEIELEEQSESYLSRTVN